jgi:Tfp pilus assembly protein PilW
MTYSFLAALLMALIVIGSVIVIEIDERQRRDRARRRRAYFDSVEDNLRIAGPR